MNSNGSQELSKIVDRIDKYTLKLNKLNSKDPAVRRNNVNLKRRIFLTQKFNRIIKVCHAQLSLARTDYLTVQKSQWKRIVTKVNLGTSSLSTSKLINIGIDSLWGAQRNMILPGLRGITDHTKQMGLILDDMELADGHK